MVLHGLVTQKALSIGNFGTTKKMTNIIVSAKFLQNFHMGNLLSK